MAAIHELTVENAPAYLRERGFAPREVVELGGGISNVVLRADLGRESIVIKQSLGKLRVADEWLFMRERIEIERDCMELLGAVLPANVPKVVFSDDENFVFAMTAVPVEGRLWKPMLLAGDTDLRAAEMAGDLLGEMHRRCASHPLTATRFASHEVFIQGRVDPYHWTTMRAHPDLAPFIHAEVGRMLATRTTLVHGDYSPKNLFVFPDRVMMLDFEVAHWGDPAFDVAFCLAHVLLKAIKFPERRGAYLDVARRFWLAYGDRAIEANVVAELGCLTLARIDGKSKEDYITEDREKDAARTIARSILTENLKRLDEVFEKV
ncbi:MAG: aminoglycoside phosphotransferase family protein [Bryobacteraceae bacterium]|nr:aminoglycoside phosphotransferase family protein [Bryobacteraceae bacterium]